jgi:hypothetical protein
LCHMQLHNLVDELLVGLEGNRGLCGGDLLHHMSRAGR